MLLRRSVIVLAVALLAGGCGGSSGGRTASSAAPSPTVAPSPTTDPAADKAAITSAWETFFTAGGTVDSHVALLEKGSTFRSELTASAQDPTAKELSSKVISVVVTGTTAAVTYDLLGKGGTVLLHNAVGEAVKVDGRWLLSKMTYCQLINLQDSTKAHPGCTS